MRIPASRLNGTDGRPESPSNPGRFEETTGAVVRNLTTTYDAAGLPTSASDTATGESLTYAHDGVGNLTGIDSSVGTNDWTYAYDPYSRLTCAVQGSSCASGSSRVLYTMDALDRALTRAKGSDVTSLTYQGIGETLAKTVNGSTTTTYAYTGGGAPLAEKTGSTASFYLRDTHGDVVGLASTAAANQGTAAFDPWGKNLDLHRSNLLPRLSGRYDRPGYEAGRHGEPVVCGGVRTVYRARRDLRRTLFTDDAQSACLRRNEPGLHVGSDWHDAGPRRWGQSLPGSHLLHGLQQRRGRWRRLYLLLRSTRFSISRQPSSTAARTFPPSRHRQTLARGRWLG
jgi:YD repeat-containing protein